MKNTCLIVLLFVFSCGKDKVVELPEINQSEISEIKDISAAYLFYDETLPDSLELNRKNLISTTNWLINVDKRLTLKQAIPKIKFLQEKKQKSEHKNENAKNYFTCNDTSKKNLGFVEFTNVVYHNKDFQDYVASNSNLDFSNKMKIDFYASNEIYLEFPLFDITSVLSKENNLLNNIKLILTNELKPVEIILSFNQNLTFQNYISYKLMVSELDLKNVTISNYEFIFN
ncbi:hypothetical protein ACFSKN_18775 [Mariniflexile gromovii]|uniref:Lipoprotein n=1 Tax=Mariniflexile gromovii TaxID=362523 RepID=A0ABS4BUT3_9FLAO|nr:hypothetical protein [Mariniflexile gromovii]MBP0904326.1 hypothetical protein [Mariniflexile gromovii]